MTPIDTSLWWIEYILKNGGESTKSPATNLSWFVYHSIDVMLLLGCIFISAVYAIILIVRVWTNRGKPGEIENKKRD